MKQVTGRELEPVSLAKELCSVLEEKYQLLVTSPSDIVEAYKARLYRLHQQVKLKKGSRVFEASIMDVNVNGQMVVDSGVEEIFNVGEVEWVINDG